MGSYPVEECQGAAENRLIERIHVRGSLLRVLCLRLLESSQWPLKVSKIDLLNLHRRKPTLGDAVT